MNDKTLFLKNILDTDFQKYLQYVSMSIIIITTYLITVIIALLTSSLDLSSLRIMAVFIVISLIFTIPPITVFLTGMQKITRISKKLRQLEKEVTS